VNCLQCRLSASSRVQLRSENELRENAILLALLLTIWSSPSQIANGMVRCLRIADNPPGGRSPAATSAGSMIPSAGTTLCRHPPPATRHRARDWWAQDLRYKGIPPSGRQMGTLDCESSAASERYDSDLLKHCFLRTVPKRVDASVSLSDPILRILQLRIKGRMFT
jgi:hypothetical protein